MRYPSQNSTNTGYIVLVNLILKLQKYPVLVKNSLGELQVFDITFKNSQIDLSSEKDTKISLLLNSETVIHVETMRKIGHNSDPKDIALEKRISILLAPSIITTRYYSVETSRILEDIFPPSTNGFYGRIGKEGEKAVFSAHNIIGSELYWLFISDLGTGSVIEAYPIHSYELGVLRFLEDYEADREKGILQKYYESDTAQKFSEEVLANPPPSWEQIRLLLGDISVRKISRGKTMRDTVDQLVPKSFPNDVRIQLMTFLAFILSEDIPKEEPVEYFNRFYSQPILRALLMGHLQFVLDKLEWPPYVKLMTMAERNQLAAPMIPLPEQAKSAWIILWSKLLELFPDWRNIAAEYAKKMNESKSVVLRLPVTPSSARKSKSGWKKRMALMVSDLALRVHVNPQTLGLNQIFYLGAAYRWPHNHISWIARLGEIASQPLHLQIMVMPPTAYQRMKRFTPGVLKVSMSLQTSNLDRYLADEQRWSMETSSVVKSLRRSISSKSLQNKYGRDFSSIAHKLSKIEAMVLDLSSRTSALSVLETLDTETHWGFSKSTMKRELEKLHSLGVIDYYYEMRYHDLVSLFIYVEGEIPRICSLADSFLSEAPSTSVMLSEKENSGVIMSRIPKSNVYTIASELPLIGNENELQLRIMRPKALRSYTHNLYQRLLKEDGTWDDDVSAFLSQARSKRKELSESNA